MIGIAFGLKKTKQKIGQILISRELENYESAKILGRKSIPRGNKIPAGPTLFNRFDNSALGYKIVKIEPGLMLSGDKLIDSEPFIKKLKKSYPEAIGGEMEGPGLQATCEREKKEWILIKGISDWGFNKQTTNKEKHQMMAISNVCDFLLYSFMNFQF
jgi:nucleoside phosphorylase